MAFLCFFARNLVCNFPNCKFGTYEYAIGASRSTIIQDIYAHLHTYGNTVHCINMSNVCVRVPYL